VNVKKDDERYRNGDSAVSELVVRVNEPDVYTPTLDLSAPAPSGSEAPKVLLFDPGVRRGLRTNAEEQLERAREVEQVALGELREAVTKYEKQESRFVFWLWPALAVLIAVGVALLFGVSR